MSTAAKTPNYNLSQVAGSDIPDWITDYTSDMSKIDAALKENADDIATVRPDEFSEDSTYAAGDYCIRDNVIYKAKTAVEAGAFDVSDWESTTIYDELSALNQNKTYKYIGSAEIGSPIQLPASWDVVIAITDNVAQRPALEFVIPLNHVANKTSIISNGYYSSDAYYGYAYVTCTKTQVTLSEYTHVGQIPDGAKLHVYYR